MSGSFSLVRTDSVSFKCWDTSKTWFIKTSKVFLTFSTKLDGNWKQSPVCERSFFTLVWHGDVTVRSLRSTFLAVYAACVKEKTLQHSNSYFTLLWQTVSWTQTSLQTAHFSSPPLGSDIAPLYLLFSKSLRHVLWLQSSSERVNLIINGLPPLSSPAPPLVHASISPLFPNAPLTTLRWVLFVAFTCDSKDIAQETKQRGVSCQRQKIC